MLFSKAYTLWQSRKPEGIKIVTSARTQNHIKRKLTSYLRLTWIAKNFSMVNMLHWSFELNFLQIFKKISKASPVLRQVQDYPRFRNATKSHQHLKDKMSNLRTSILTWSPIELTFRTNRIAKEQNVNYPRQKFFHLTTRTRVAMMIVPP